MAIKSKVLESKDEENRMSAATRTSDILAPARNPAHASTALTSHRIEPDLQIKVTDASTVSSGGQPYRECHQLNLLNTPMLLLPKTCKVSKNVSIAKYQYS